MLYSGVRVQWDPCNASVLHLHLSPRENGELCCSLGCIFPWWGNNFTRGLYEFMHRVHFLLWASKTIFQTDSGSVSLSLGMNANTAQVQVQIWVSLLPNFLNMKLKKSSEWLSGSTRNLCFSKALAVYSLILLCHPCVVHRHSQYRSTRSCLTKDLQNNMNNTLHSSFIELLKIL